MLFLPIATVAAALLVDMHPRSSERFGALEGGPASLVRRADERLHDLKDLILSDSGLMMHRGLKHDLLDQVQQIDRLLHRIESSRHPKEVIDRAEEELGDLKTVILSDVILIVRGRLKRKLLERVQGIEHIIDRLEDRLRAPETPLPVPGLSVVEARRLIEAETWDRDKVEAMERIVSIGARFTTAEIRSLAALPTFDSGRINALVALYPTATDPHRYELAFDILEFGSSPDKVRERLGL